MSYNHSTRRIISVLILLAILTLNVTDGLLTNAKAAVNSDKVSTTYLNTTETYLYMDGQKALTYDFDIKESAQKKGSTYYWYIKSEKGNPNAVKIDKNTGLVTAKEGGTAYIRCKITLTDGSILRPEAKVIVINNIKMVDIKADYNTNEIKAGHEMDFDRIILDTSAGKGIATDGITRWEISEDSTRIATVSDSGTIFPVKAGTFKLRAVCFQDVNAYTKWLTDKKKFSSNITATSKWIKIKVKASNTAVVTNQKQLDVVLANTSYSQVTIKTKSKRVFTIADQNYSNVDLMVNAPNSDVINRGFFKSITINAIKDSTWIEYADGNIVYLSDDTASFVIEKGAQVKQIVIDTPNSNITLEIHGTVELVRMEQPSQVTLTGESSGTPIEVETTATGSTLVASLPLILTVNSDINIVLNDGAEATTLNKKASDIVVKLDNQTQQAITITLEGSKPETVEPGSKNFTPTQTPSVTPILTPTLVPSPTITPIPTTAPYIPPVPSTGSTPTPTPTPTLTPTPTPTSTPTPTPTSTPTPTPTSTPTPTPTSTPTPTPVPDTEKPVITLLGEQDMFLEYGATFTDPGATASDDTDGNLSDKITVTGEVNTSKLGDYELTYQVSDHAGNRSEVTRSIHVYDETAPTMTMKGDTILFLQLGEAFIDEGVTATDNYDGDLTGNITVWGNDFNTKYEGDYLINYEVEDSSGNYSHVQRLVSVSDSHETNGPVLLLYGWNLEFADEGMPYTLPGAIAVDYKDKDVTDGIVVTGTFDTTTEGEYLLHYRVTDSDGHTSTEQRTVVVFDTNGSPDTTPPKIILNGPLDYYLDQGQEYHEFGAFAYDFNDLFLDDEINITGSVDTDTPGTYTMTYTVSDSVGLTASATRNVTIRDNVPPVLSLIGDPIVFLEPGETFVDTGTTAVDNVDGDVIDSLIIYGNDFNTNEEGDYIICYEVHDSSGNYRTIFRIVSVSDTHMENAPILLLQGWDLEFIQEGDEYVIPDPIAIDFKDKDISDKILVSGSVNTSKEGEYLIEYSITDSDGNSAAMTRTIVVFDTDGSADTTPPRIILNGPNEWYLSCGDPFEDPNGFAYDLNDGYLGDKLVVSGSVNTDVPGTYELVYSVTDNTGKTTNVIRYVYVNDYTNPDITLVGDPILYVNKGDSFIDPGVMAIDNADGDITDQVIVYGADFNTNENGVYWIRYEVTDRSGNFGHHNRIVCVSDNLADEPPIIFLYGWDRDYTDKNNYKAYPVFAKDYTDGDITDQVIITGDTVDPDVPGEYIIHYNVEDSDGNTAEERIRLIVILDPERDNNEPPRIYLYGDPIFYLNQGDDYQEQGSYAYDFNIGYLDDQITIDGTVDTSTPGTYTITYTVTNDLGKSSSATRTVIVQENDKTAPVITLNGDPIVFVQYGEAYTELGATASDNSLGDLTDRIRVHGGTYGDGNIDTLEAGYFHLYYDVWDDNGNFSSMKRLVVVSEQDNNLSPAILLLGADIDYVEMGTDYHDPGAIAWDIEEGEITPQIVADYSTLNMNMEGYYNITYTITDESDNSTSIIRRIDVYDKANPVNHIPPEIYSYQQNIYLNIGDSFTVPEVFAWDDLDGMISEKVIMTGYPDTNIPGIYELKFNVSDSSGNPAEEYTIIAHVEDRTQPVITISGSAIVFIGLNESYTDSGATASDNIDGDITDHIIPYGASFSTEWPGEYTIWYEVQDSCGNYGHASRIVSVSDTHSTDGPVIKLFGWDWEYACVGTGYVVPYAMAVDYTDGDITEQLSVTGSPINSDQAEEYVLNYSVTDQDGNTTTKLRHVILYDPDNPTEDTIPQISLNWESNINWLVGDIFYDPGAEAFDLSEGYLSDKIQITSGLDVNTPGTYEIIYTITDSAGNTASVSRFVTVIARSEPLDR